MWLGRPALLTNAGDSSMLVREGIDGFVASAATVQHVAEALERLWLQRDHLSELGKSAASRSRSFLPEDPITTASAQILSIIQR